MTKRSAVAAEKKVSPGPRNALARRAWGLMFDCMMASAPERARSLERRGLTPNDARALWMLDSGDGRPMGSLARQWGCDPANATLIIDRLERLGFAERRESATDRRIRLAFLTGAGERTKQELLEEYRRPPRTFQRLSSHDLEALVQVLLKLHDSGLNEAGVAKMKMRPA